MLLVTNIGKGISKQLCMQSIVHAQGIVVKKNNVYLLLEAMLLIHIRLYGSSSKIRKGAYILCSVRVLCLP